MCDSEETIEITWPVTFFVIRLDTYLFASNKKNQRHPLQEQYTWEKKKQTY